MGLASEACILLKAAQLGAETIHPMDQVFASSGKLACLRCGFRGGSDPAVSTAAHCWLTIRTQIWASLLRALIPHATNHAVVATAEPRLLVRAVSSTQPPKADAQPTRRSTPLSLSLSLHLPRRRGWQVRCTNACMSMPQPVAAGLMTSLLGCIRSVHRRAHVHAGAGKCRQGGLAAMLHERG